MPEMPKFEAPDVKMPEMPEFKAPEMPKFSMPKIDVPKMEMPKIDMPEMPKVDIPDKPAAPAGTTNFVWLFTSKLCVLSRSSFLNWYFLSSHKSQYQRLRLLNLRRQRLMYQSSTYQSSMLPNLTPLKWQFQSLTPHRRVEDMTLGLLRSLLVVLTTTTLSHKRFETNVHGVLLVFLGTPTRKPRYVRRNCRDLLPEMAECRLVIPCTHPLFYGFV